MSIRFILFLSIGLLTFKSTAQTKRALIIAIGKYAPLDGKGWRSISSVNDTSLILPSIRKQGFAAPNTSLLINEQASIEGINNAFQTLINETKPNDIVLIHISAHGEQIQDDNKDEVDGLDESIVTYNAILPKHSKNFEIDVKQYFRDDQLGIYLEKIRAAAGKKGEVLVFMDNCHSGSGTRAIETYRGGEAPFVNKKPNSTTLKETSVSTDKYSENADLAPFIVISASRADELNAEMKINNVGYGSLSYALSQAMDNLTPSSTYEGFYTSVQSVMNQHVPKQHPVIEGNALNKKFWGGDFVMRPSFFQIISVKDERMVVIDGGIVSGITKGSVINLYPPDTYDTLKTKAISRGIVTSVENFKATVDLDSDLPNMSAPYWAFLKKVYYPIDAIGINFDPLTSSNETKISNERMDKYLKILSLNDQVSLSTTPSLRIVQINKKDVLVDVKTDYAFDTLGVGEPVSDKLNASIQRYLQYQFLKSYVVNDTNYRIRVRFLPYVNGKVDTTLLSKKMVNGVYNIEEGDKIVVEVANLSKSPIFFNIIDLEPTGKINAIMPKKSSDVKKNIPANELTVPSGDTIIFHKFPVTIYKPYGNEVFKFFVSNQTLDLEYITTKSRDVKKDITSDLERVFRNSYKSGSRGDIGTRDGSVVNVPFIIVPKNQ